MTDISYVYNSVKNGDNDTDLDGVISQFLLDENKTETTEEWRIANYIMLRKWAYPDPTELNAAYTKLHSVVPAQMVNGERELDQYYTKCLGVRERFPGEIPVIETVDELRNRLKRIVNTSRKNKVNAGFIVNGVLFAFDANARIAYQELALVFNMNPAFFTDWKADIEWVVMDITLYQQVVNAGMLHVQTCFAWQKAKEEELNVCTTVEELNNVEVVYE